MTSRLPLFALAAALALGFAAGPAGEAQAEGCLKGAIVGGVAGHYAGHHFIAGAIGGCIVGHHMATVERGKAEGVAGPADAGADADRHAEVGSPHALLLSARSAFGSSGQRGRAGAATTGVTERVRGLGRCRQPGSFGGADEKDVDRPKRRNAACGGARRRSECGGLPYLHRVFRAGLWSLGHTFTSRRIAVRMGATRSELLAGRPQVRSALSRRLPPRNSVVTSRAALAAVYPNCS